MIQDFTMKLQFSLQRFTMCLQFFTHPFYFVKLGIAKNSYNFSYIFHPPRARVIFFRSSFFSDFYLHKKVVKVVKSFEKYQISGNIGKQKNCKEAVKHCKECVNKTVKGNEAMKTESKKQQGATA